MDAVIAFPLPELSGGLMYGSPLHLPNRLNSNFVDFKATSNRQPIPAAMEVRAFAEGHDVTDRLRKMGLPISVLDRGADAAIKRLSPVQASKLLDEGLVVYDDVVLPGGKKSQRTYWPMWDTRFQFYWTQHLPANNTVDLE